MQNWKWFSTISLSVILFFSSNVSAQTVPVGLEEKLTATLDSMLLVIGNKSLSAALQIEDGAVWSHAIGESSAVIDVTSEYKYEIGSVTKTLTSACVLQLVDEGLLDLDDSIYSYLTALPFVDSAITIRQLLRHQSGLYEVLANPDFQPQLLEQLDSIWQAEDVITTFIQPAYDIPGSGWSYCNTGYILLGTIIESVTGNPFYTEIRSRFLDPLELYSIGIPAFEPYSGPIAHVWLDLDGDGDIEDGHSLFYNWLSLNSAVAAPGGYYSNASDITVWMRTYMRGDIISPTLLAEAQETITAPGLPGTYGLGLIHKTFIGYNAYGHGGDLAYSANAWYFPELDISISVLNNDATIISWDLEPVTIALLQAYNEWKLTSAVAEIPTFPDIQISPNPFDAVIYIDISEAVTEQLQCKLYTIYGQLVWNDNIPSGAAGQLYFNLPANLPSGAYFFEVTREGERLLIEQLVK